MEHSKPKRGLAPKIAAGILLFGALLILLSATPKSLLAGLTTISRDSDGSVTIVLLRPDGDCGDLNGDRQIDVSDVVFQLQVVVGIVTADPVQRFLGDATQDGDITVLDAIAIMQNIVGQRGPFQKCGPVGAVSR